VQALREDLLLGGRAVSGQPEHQHLIGLAVGNEEIPVRSDPHGAGIVEAGGDHRRGEARRQFRLDAVRHRDRLGEGSARLPGVGLRHVFRLEQPPHTRLIVLPAAEGLGARPHVVGQDR
jgi:hypothetical protein